MYNNQLTTNPSFFSKYQSHPLELIWYPAVEWRQIATFGLVSPVVFDHLSIHSPKFDQARSDDCSCYRLMCIDINREEG